MLRMALKINICQRITHRVYARNSAQTRVKLSINASYARFARRGGIIIIIGIMTAYGVDIDAIVASMSVAKSAGEEAGEIVA